VLFAFFWLSVGVAVGFLIGTLMAFSYWHKEVERMSKRYERYVRNR